MLEPQIISWSVPTAKAENHSSFIYIRGAGYDCLNLNFRQNFRKFPIGLHVILQIQIEKFENDCYIM